MGMKREGKKITTTKPPAGQVISIETSRFNRPGAPESIREERTMMTIECESCAEAGQHGVPATTHSSNPDWSGYDLCAECAAHYDAEGPIGEEVSNPICIIRGGSESKGAK